MEPKQKRLTDAEAALRKAEDNLAEKQRSLDEVQARSAHSSRGTHSTQGETFPLGTLRAANCAH